MIHIYTGDGKGKTTAAFGLAMRMAGSGGKVIIVQFLKGSPSCEISMAEKIGIEVYRCDKDYGFFSSMTDDEKQQITDNHNKNLKYVYENAARYDMIVFDEIFAAYEFNLLDRAAVREFISSQNGAEIVLTGRNPDGFFMDKADYISEIKKLKHPFDKGVKARKGIEY